MADEWKCAACDVALNKNQRYLLEGLDWCETHYREASALPDPRSLASGAVAPAVSSGTDAPERPEQRYGATRFLIGLFRVVAVVGVLVPIVMAAAASSALEYTTSHTYMVIAGIVSGVVLLAAAEGLQIVIDMEEHQRAMRSHLEQIVKRDAAPL